MLRSSEAVRMAGGEPRPVRSQDSEAQLFEHLDRGRTLPVDHTLAEADPANYEALVLPGGVANPDRLHTARQPSLSRGPSSPRASRSRRSATRRGCWWRPV